jgi:hypothetical protein
MRQFLHGDGPYFIRLIQKQSGILASDTCRSNLARHSILLNNYLLRSACAFGGVVEGRSVQVLAKLCYFGAELWRQ